MDYGQILRDAWQVVWKNKFLLILGFLAALGSGYGSGGNNFSYEANASDLPPQFAEQMDLFLAAFTPIILSLICLGIFIAIVFWLIRLTAQAGLISAADRLHAGEKVTLGEALGAGLGKLGRMIGIYLLLYGPFILLALLIAAVAIAIAGTAISFSFAEATEALEGVLASMGIVLACLVCGLCLLLPLLLVVTIILPFAQRAAVLEDKGVTASVRRAWQVIKSNLAETAILVLLFVAIGIGYAIAVALVMVPLMALLFVPMMIGFVSDGTFAISNVFAVVCGGLALGLLAAFLNALWTTYRSTAMTLAYRQLTEKAPK